MARLDLTRRQLKGSSNTAPLEVTDAQLQAVLLADGAQFDLLGGEILYVRNPTGGALSVTLVGAPDDNLRDVDQVESIAAASNCFIGPLRQSGWKQSDGKCYIDVSASGLLVALLTPP
jgi:hypothetical protein